jgi:N-methylhydantoinase A
VDVGGTFHDLAWFDETTRRFRTAKVHRIRGEESKGFLEGLGKFGAPA